MAELGSLHVHKKDRSYKRREIKKKLPPRLGSLADSFLTGSESPVTWPGWGWGMMVAWNGVGERWRREGSRAQVSREPKDRGRTAPTIYGCSHALPSSFSLLLLMSLAKH